MNAQYSTIACSSWADFRSLVDPMSENWAFRGQSVTEWSLRNAIERTGFIHKQAGIEKDFIAEFQRGARNYLRSDDTPTHLIEWLALMQHHGAPTRLLDFTRSPFIAAYFAFEQCQTAEAVADNSVAIWAIHIPYLKTRALEVLHPHFKEAFNDSQGLVNERLFEEIFNADSHPIVFPVEPFSMNRRYSLQQSVFISTGIAREPFMEQLQFLKEDLRRAVLKIELPVSLQHEVLRHLLRMNITRASLFPDLDGYADSMRLRYEIMRTPEERFEEMVHRFGEKSGPSVGNPIDIDSLLP